MKDDSSLPKKALADQAAEPLALAKQINLALPYGGSWEEAEPERRTLCLAIAALSNLPALLSKIERMEAALREVRAKIAPLAKQGEDYIWRPVIISVTAIDIALKQEGGDDTEGQVRK